MCVSQTSFIDHLGNKIGALYVRLPIFYVLISEISLFFDRNGMSSIGPMNLFLKTPQLPVLSLGQPQWFVLIFFYKIVDVRNFVFFHVNCCSVYQATTC